MLSVLSNSSLPSFAWAAARVPGADHDANAIPCQDALSFRSGVSDTVPYITVALADGAGSAQYAEEAAKTAASLFTAFVASEIGAWGLDGLDDLAIDAVGSAHGALRKLAASREAHHDHCATTLLGIVVTPERSALVQIGDGGIVLGSPFVEPWRLAFLPQHGAYRNESRFVTDDDAFDHLQVTTFDGPPGTLVAFTDGLEDLLLDPFDYAVHAPLFERLTQQLGRHTRRGFDKSLSIELSQLMRSGAVRSRTSDDITLLALRFREVLS